MNARMQVLCSRSQHDPRLHFVWLLDAFFGWAGASFYAVTDDFGNLVRVGGEQ
jgi:hypothetical protein